MSWLEHSKILKFKAGKVVAESRELIAYYSIDVEED